jgi:F-type H+-transporting ATPase subunit b
MAANTANAVTEQPAHEKGGFPPFNVETYPSQLFWLAITFAVLFVVLWRIAGPRIQETIAARRKHIEDHITSAENHRREAEGASAAYRAALTAARTRAQNEVEQRSKQVIAESERAKAAEEVEAQKAVSAAEARIADARSQAKERVAKAVQEAAVEIVLRLTGETVSPEEAAAVTQSLDGR